MGDRMMTVCVCEKRGVTGIVQRPDETVGALENALPGDCCSVAVKTLSFRRLMNDGTKCIVELAQTEINARC